MNLAHKTVCETPVLFIPALMVKLQEVADSERISP
jgi:hypothetical protein